MLISDVSIKRPVFASMLNLLIIIFGLMSFKKMGVDTYPRVDLPIVNIRIQVPGATPSFIEQNVLKPVEVALRSIEGIDSIASTASIGQASFSVAFKLSQNTDVAVNNIRNAMTSVTGRKSWPTTALAPAVKPVNPNASSVVQVALSMASNDLNVGTLSQYINDIFIPTIEQEPGVGDVGVAGLQLPEFDILFNNQRLNALNITPLQAIEQIKSRIVTIPGGTVADNKTTYNIDTSTSPNSFSELAQMSIALPSGQVVKLNEIAQIESTVQKLTTYAESDTKNVIIVYISKASNANTVEVAQNVRAAIARLVKGAAGKIDVRIVNDNARFISESLDAVKFDIGLGALLTIAIVFVFLHSMRATLVSAVAIPTSIIGAFAVMYLLDFTLNTMTTLALSLSIGIIVDDAIMVIENIYRHLEMGKPPFQAARDATSEIGIPALAITFAIVAVFLPVAFMEGPTGRYFYEFSVTVSVAVLISLFVAFTLTPTFGSRLLIHAQTHKHPIFVRLENFFTAVEHFYVKMIRFTLARRYKTVLFGIGVLVLSIFLLRFVPTTFQPKVDNSVFAVNMQLDPNTDLPEVSRRAREVEQWLKTYPGVSNVFFRTTNDSGVALFVVNLVSPNKRNYTQAELQKRIRKDILKFKQNPVETFGIGRPGRLQQPIQVILTHSDLNVLQKYSVELQNHLRGLADISDVNTDAPVPSKQIKVVPNLAVANTLGVSSTDIANSVSYLFYGATIGSLENKGDSYDIVAKLREPETKTPQDLLLISVPGKNNSLVPLDSVAAISLQEQSSVIQHYNGVRQTTVVAEYDGKDLGNVIRKIEEFVQKTAPTGLNFYFDGDAKNLKDSNSAVIQALLLSFLFAYMVLCAQFESLLTPFVVILSVPLAFSGAFIFLLLFNQPMSLYAMVGLILLTGLVKKNAILLLDFTEHKMRDGGLSMHAALETAGHIRLRPILMTSFAMIFGMLPMAFGTSLGHEQRAPMGIAVIGGLVSSTLLTLLVIPCVFSLFGDWKRAVLTRLFK